MISLSGVSAKRVKIYGMQQLLTFMNTWAIILRPGIILGDGLNLISIVISWGFWNCA
jgi:hypothetical protein